MIIQSALRGKSISTVVFYQHNLYFYFDEGPQPSHDPCKHASTRCACLRAARPRHGIIVRFHRRMFLLYTCIGLSSCASKYAFRQTNIVRTTRHVYVFTAHGKSLVIFDRGATASKLFIRIAI
jgi:hypothetical protein